MFTTRTAHCIYIEGLNYREMNERNLILGKEPNERLVKKRLGWNPASISEEGRMT